LVTKLFKEQQRAEEMLAILGYENK
jgi:hypothetical protein